MSSRTITRVDSKKYSLAQLPSQAGVKVACPLPYLRRLREHVKNSRGAPFPLFRAGGWVYRLEQFDRQVICMRYRDYDRIVKSKLVQFAPYLETIKSKIGEPTDFKELPITNDPYNFKVPFYTMGSGFFDLWVLDHANGVSTVIFKIARVYFESRELLAKMHVCDSCKSLFEHKL